MEIIFSMEGFLFLENGECPPREGKETYCKKRN